MFAREVNWGYQSKKKRSHVETKTSCSCRVIYRFICHIVKELEHLEHPFPKANSCVVLRLKITQELSTTILYDDSMVVFELHPIIFFFFIFLKHKTKERKFRFLFSMARHTSAYFAFLVVIFLLFFFFKGSHFCVI